MIDVKMWLFAFTALFVLDFIWGKYIDAVAKGSAKVAAAWSVPIYVVGGLVTVEYVKDPMLLIPASFGSFLGTYLGVKRKVTKAS